MDNTLVAKVLVALIVVAAVILDWPRAIAGFILGWTVRLNRWPFWVTILGIVAIAAAGELFYSVIGRSAGVSSFGFLAGCVAAGATAVGLLRVARWIAEDVEAP